MKKVNFIIFTFTLIFFFSSLKANNNIPLKEYLEQKNIEVASTQIYLLNRCSAIYAYSSAIILKTDPVNSKKFIEVANNLLFKSVELKIIDNKEKLENAQKRTMKEREELFNNYAKDGKKNWNKNKSYFKGSYISEDMSICAKLVNDK
jgi:hypothetical protein|tara:strand:+ start:158 stop:601 length:444 start_codon:yes stop_codon:yes gene_type:complete